MLSITSGVPELEHSFASHNVNQTRLLSQKCIIDTFEVECGMLRVLVASRRMENLSLPSNNQGTHSSIHGGDIEANTIFQNQVPMDIGVGY